MDRKLKNFKNIYLIKRKKYLKEVFHLYEIRIKNKKIRDRLIYRLIQNGIDAKIHYPTPMHLQPAAKYLKYKKGDFPMAETIAKTTISLPVHEFISKSKLDIIVKIISENIKS